MARKPQGKETSEAPLKGATKITSPPSSRMLYLVMALVTVVILVGGYLFYRDQERQMRQRVENGLSVVAQLKVEQITDWRAERMTDARSLAESPFSTEGVERYLAAPTDTEAKDKLIARLAVIDKAYRYQDILLTDVNGSVLLSLTDSVRHLSDMTLAQLAVAIKERKAVITDLHLHPVENAPHLDVIAPLFPWRKDSSQAIGAVVFCIDPSQYLYPLLQSWPMPSQTAETLLVERDGDQVLFLNELRHQKDTALKLRIPLSRQELPAVMAVLGKEGIVQGKDYRGAEVLAALKHIPDSPWYMVAKIDTSEALAAWRFRAGIIVAFIAGLLVAGLAVTGLIWQRRQRLAYQALYQAELGLRQSQERSRALVERSHDAITLLEADGTVLYDSPSVVRILGYEPTERIGRRVFDFVHPDQRQPMADGFAKFARQPGAVAPSEVLFLHKDGTPRWIEGIRTNLLHDPAIGAMVVNYRDITERKLAEEKIKHLNLTLRAIRNVNQLIARGTDRDSLLKGACENFTNTRGYFNAWVALLDESGSLVTAAEAGLGEKFLQVIELLKRGELPDCGKKVLKESGAVVIEDPVSTCIDCPLAKDYSGRLGMSVRLEYGGKVYGLMTVSVPPGIPVEKEERELFEEVAGDIAFALYSMEQEHERKQAEEALHRSEQNFRDSIESSPLGVRIVTEDGRTLYVNRALLDIWGYGSLEELEAVLRKERYTLESYAEHKIRKDKRRRGEFVPSDYEISIVRKDGEIRHLAVSRSELQWNGKRQFQVLYQDITERKRAEEALRQSEEKYRSLVERANDGICVIQDGIIKYLNSRLAEMGSGTVEEFIDTPFINHLHPDSLREMADFYKRRMAAEDVTPIYETALMRKDGSKLDVEVNAGVISYKGEPADLVIVRNVTERKQAEEALLGSEQRLKEAQALGKIGSWEFDLATQKVEWSDEVYVLYERDKALGPPSTAEEAGYYAPEEAKRLREFARLATETGEQSDYGVMAKLPSGRIAFFDATMRPIKDKEGRVIKLFGTVHDITKRKRAEEELKASEEKYRTILKEIEDSYFEVDTAGNLTFVNDATCRSLGYSREELLGMNYRGFTVKEDIRHVHQAFNRVYTTGKPDKGFPWVIVRKDGSTGFVEATISLVRNPNGEIIGFRGVGRDITERKKSEDALRGSEQRLKEAQALGKIGNWELDLATQKIEWSDEVYVLYERDKALGPPSPEEEAGYYAPEEAERLREFARIATETGEQSDYGVMAKLPSGRIVFFDATLRPIKDKEGRVIKLFGTVQDITDREKADETIEKQREEYRTIFDSVRPMIAYLGRDSTVMRINKAGASVFGLEPKEVIGKTLYDLFPTDEADVLTRENMAVISSGKPILGAVMQYTRPSGEKKWAQVDTIPYIDEHGHIIGVIQFNQDITRRKLAEENLSQSYEKLEKTLESAVEALASIAEIRDPYTAGHQMRVTRLACAIAAEMGLSAEIIADLRMAGVLHDIGKMQVPAEILSKPGKLTELEFSMIKNHPQIGYDIVKKIELPCSVATVVLNHHERLDGSGYPKGLRGEDIPLQAKILAVSDVVEAMASHRPYRPALGIDKALEEISLNRGVLYDSDVVDACLKLFKEKGFKFE